MSALPLIASHFMRARWRGRVLRGARLARFQDRRARLMVAYARRHAPFYRRRWADHSAADWRTLPLVDKQLMMANFDGFTTRGLDGAAAMRLALEAEQRRDFTLTLDGLTIGLSSGTSGHRGLFVVSRWEQMAWAGTILARTLHLPFGRLMRDGYRVALFLRSNSNLYERVGSSLIRFRYFDLMLPLADAVAALNQFRPQAIVGPPSLLLMLAAERQRGALRSAPERLISAAEVLEPHDRDQLSAIFEAPVEQIYQCTEGLLAVSCAAGRLHVQEDIVALQYAPLDDDSTRVTPIVTDLWRTTQPIIRYRLNDMLQLDPQRCSCGSDFQVIQAIDGRCDDLCFFERRAGGARPFFPDTIRRMILLSSPAILDYQAIQTHCGQLRIFLSTPPNSSFTAVAQSVRASVAATLAQYDCRPAALQIEQGIPPVAAGVKRRRVQRLS
jgi:phenylacetate-CoA ligase